MLKTGIWLALFLFFIICPSAGRAEQVVKVGYYDIKPLVFKDSNGDPVGLFIDVLDHVAHKEGWKLQFDFSTWPDIYQRLQSGELDLVPCVATSETRREFLSFSDDYLFLDWGVIYARPGIGIESIFDLKGKRVAALSESFYYEGLSQLLTQFDIAVEFHNQKNFIDVFRAIDRRQVDAGVSTSLTGLQFEREFGAERTGIVFSPAKLAYAVKKGQNDPLLASLNQEIRSLKADKRSLFYDSYERWISNSAPHKTPPALWWGVGSLLGGMILIGSWSVSLRRQVERQTGHLEAEIVQRRLSEEALREANANIENLFTHASAPIIVWDANLLITRFNRAFENLTGMLATEVVGKHISQLFPDIHFYEVLIMVDKSFAGELWESVEIPIKHLDGSIRTVIWNSATVYLDGRDAPLSTIAQGQDITELRALIMNEHHQEEQQRIRELVENEERSRLSRDLHDGAGQSLQAIRLHLQLLESGKMGGDAPLEMIAKLTKEVSDVATELREISHQLHPSYLHEKSLDAAISSRCEMLRHRGMPLLCEKSGDFSSLSYIVKDNLYRIMQEAVANSVRHADAGEIKVGLYRHESGLQLVVSDDGCGISENSGEEGMGVRIMKERATMIGASLDLTSSQAGTTVTVNLELP